MRAADADGCWGGHRGQGEEVEKGTGPERRKKMRVILVWSRYIEGGRCGKEGREVRVMEHDEAGKSGWNGEAGPTS